MLEALVMMFDRKVFVYVSQKVFGNRIWKDILESIFWASWIHIQVNDIQGKCFVFIVNTAYRAFVH